MSYMAQWNLFYLVNGIILKLYADDLQFPTVVFSF